MAYARFSEGDVYVYQNFNNQYVCCACLLKETDGDIVCSTPKEMLSHLQQHIAEKQIVPERCLKSLKWEISDEDS